MATSFGIFHDILAEEYKKKIQNVDIVGTKRKNFNLMVNKAHNDLRKQNFADAKQSYFDVIDYLLIEPYHDELNLSSDVEFCVKCCFCYSSLMDETFCQGDTVITILTKELVKSLQEEYIYRLFPKYLQVLLSFKINDWVMTLYWCNAVKTHIEEEEAGYASLDFFKEMLPNQFEINAKIQIYEEEAFYGYGRKIANNYLTKPKTEKHKSWTKEVNNLITHKVMNLKQPISEVDLHKIFHQYVFPLWCMTRTDKKCISFYEENFLSECNECMRAKVQKYAMKEHPTAKETKVKFNELLKKFVDLYHKISECNFTDSIEDCICDKIGEIENLVANGTKRKKKKKSDEKLCIGQTQTDKIKCGNKFIQTEGVKCKNAEVQVNLEPQILNTLLDIKSKLLVSQEKKDDVIKKLNTKISELNENVIKETKKRKSEEEEYQQKLAKHQFEIKTLKEQLKEYDKERKQECEKKFSLQKLLVEQINEKFNIHKNIYKTIEKKSIFMISYLKEINRFVTTNSIPNDVDVKQNIDVWDRYLNKIRDDKNHLNSFYKNIKEGMINSDQFNVTWPEIPELPRDEDNVVFTSFKPAIQNIIDIEDKLINKFKPNNQSQPQLLAQVSQTVQYNMPRPQYPVQNSSFFIGPRLVYPTLSPPMPSNIHPQYGPTFSRDRVPTEMHMQRQQSYVEQKPNSNIYQKMSKSTEFINKTSKKETEVFAGSVEEPDKKMKAGATSLNGIDEKEKNNKNYQEREKIIFEYVLENCPGATEGEVTLAILHVLDENKGTLSKLPKEKIVQDVKMALRIEKQSVWVTPKSPHVDWKNDHSENNCSICFEEFSVSETYTLHCQHEYHKECIKKWLKTSSVCPICRIHSVIDDEFPPLH